MIGKDKYIHFIVGMIVAAFCVLILHMGFLSIIPVVIFGALKEVCDKLTYGLFDIWDFLATCLGGFVIVILQLL